MLKEGEIVPNNMELPDQDGNIVKLDDLKGQKLIIYFYPKDLTPGCTTEAKNFQGNLDTYVKKDVKIIGISKDSVASHRKFADKYGLKFTLLSDKDGKVAKIFGALDGESVKRRTWVISEDWKIEKFYDKVSPATHNEELCTEILKIPR
ncbi:MAG: peroxiredoxin [Promethearchaeota archaeon CR_4]|nr:MAG: peroxiredoxin [Candidatus Lokiarchaeota archaeon CR_4]